MAKLQSTIESGELSGRDWIDYSIHAHNWYYNSSGELKYQIFHAHYRSEEDRDKNYKIARESVLSHKRIPEHLGKSKIF